MSIAIAALGPSPALAYTAESPEVRRMVKSAQEYLSGATDSRLGGACLIGLVFIKERQFDHPRVTQAVQQCLEFAKQPTADMAAYREVYSLGLAPIFLCELDPQRYKSVIEKFLAALWRRQQPGGGFGYVGNSRGDTSMTQYAVLAMWTAHRSGFEIPGQNAISVAEWLLRTQDPTGAWGYQGEDPGENSNQPEPQTEIRPSLVAAGLGSVYVCSSLLGLNELVLKVKGEVSPVPPAFVAVPEVGGTSLDMSRSRGLASRVKKAIVGGNKWIAGQPIIPAEKRYLHYYLYGLERYQSFRELAEGRSVREPEWYDAGVEYLAASQQSDGSFPSNTDSLAIDTAFATLFLQRSTKKAIQANPFGEGLLVGGRGLPADTSDVRLLAGRVVGASQEQTSEALLAILEDPNNPDFERLLADPGSVLLDADEILRSDDIQRFHRLVRGGDYRVRRMAVELLGQRRNLDHVPILIYALGDPDQRIAARARDALRLISRKIDGVVPADADQGNSGVDEARLWKNWLKTVRPGAEFVQ